MWTKLRDNLHRLFSAPVESDGVDWPTLGRLLAELGHDPVAALNPASTLVPRLVHAWGNEGWSALHEFSRAVVAEAIHSPGPILECGSGLTTLMLGTIANRTGAEVWTLENSPKWGARTRAGLNRTGPLPVHLHIAELRSHPECDWYDTPPTGMPETFTLVVCDGPPHDTRGGRSGLMVAMRRRLAPGCVILLDDAARQHERELGARWRDELGARCELLGIEKPYYRLELPGGKRRDTRASPPA